MRPQSSLKAGQTSLKRGQTSISSLRRGGGVPPWVPAGAAWAVDFAADRAWIDDVAYGGLDALISADLAGFVRASSGLYVPASGQPVAFAAGQPRRGDRGLLIEAAATNLLPRAIVSPSTWSVSATSGSVSQIGSEDFAGQAAPVLRITNGSLYLAMNISAGATYTASLWVKTPNAEHVGRLVALRQPGETSSPASLLVAATAEWTRVSVAKQAAAATYNFLIGNRSAVAGESGTNSPVDLAVVAQLEAGAVASSQIMTAGAAAARAADQLTLKPAEGTYDIVATFDDDSTQAIAGQTIDGGGWPVPTDLDRRYVKSIVAGTA